MSQISTLKFVKGFSSKLSQHFLCGWHKQSPGKDLYDQEREIHNKMEGKRPPKKQNLGNRKYTIRKQRTHNKMERRGPPKEEEKQKLYNQEREIYYKIEGTNLGKLEKQKIYYKHCQRHNGPRVLSL